MPYDASFYVLLFFQENSFCRQFLNILDTNLTAIKLSLNCTTDSRCRSDHDCCCFKLNQLWTETLRSWVLTVAVTVILFQCTGSSNFSFRTFFINKTLMSNHPAQENSGRFSGSNYRWLKVILIKMALFINKLNLQFTTYCNRSWSEKLGMLQTSKGSRK